MDSPRRPAYPARVNQRLLPVALCLLPAVAPPAPTTGAGDGSTAGEATGTETSTMPPEYEPCGCRSDQLGGGWSLALTGLAVTLLRRRRP